MSDINSVTLIGRLVKDADLKTFQSGVTSARFSVAVNKRQKKGEKWEDVVNFFDCQLWGKAAETLAAYLIKGKQVALIGELRQERWESDGKKNSRIIINVATIQLLGKGPASEHGPVSAIEEAMGENEFHDDIPF